QPRGIARHASVDGVGSLLHMVFTARVVARRAPDHAVTIIGGAPDHAIVVGRTPDHAIVAGRTPDHAVTVGRAPDDTVAVVRAPDAIRPGFPAARRAVPSSAGHAPHDVF